VRTSSGCLVGEASRPAPVARVAVDPTAQAAATRAVLWRYERGHLTAGETAEVLRALGVLAPPELEASRPLLRGFDTRFKSRRKAPETAEGSTATPLAPAPASPSDRNPALPPTKDVSDATNRSA
jgi:hypothetical protein